MMKVGSKITKEMSKLRDLKSTTQMEKHPETGEAVKIYRDTQGNAYILEADGFREVDLGLEDRQIQDVIQGGDDMGVANPDLVAGVVESVREHTTPKGKMYFLKIEGDDRDYSAFGSPPEWMKLDAIASFTVVTNQAGDRTFYNIGKDLIEVKDAGVDDGEKVAEESVKKAIKEATHITPAPEDDSGGENSLVAQISQMTPPPRVPDGALFFDSVARKEVIGKAAEVATDLAQIISAQELEVVIKGNKYVEMPGWQILCAMMRCTAVLTWCRREDVGFVSRADVYNPDGRVVGSGEAFCGRDEVLTRRDGSTYKRWDSEFKVRSMSQTRATRKAYQMAFGWIMALAGYRPESAEEVMD